MHSKVRCFAILFQTEVVSWLSRRSSNVRSRLRSKLKKEDSTDNDKSEETQMSKENEELDLDGDENLEDNENTENDESDEAMSASQSEFVHEVVYINASGQECSYDDVDDMISVDEYSIPSDNEWIKYINYYYCCQWSQKQNKIKKNWSNVGHLNESTKLYYFSSMTLGFDTIFVTILYSVFLFVFVFVYANDDDDGRST